MRRIEMVIGALVLVAVAGVRPALAGGLKGSHASMVHQHSVAVHLDYSFVRTPAQVTKLVADSALVQVAPNADLSLSGVSYPYARPETRDFVLRLAALYHGLTGSRLVVTSLTRPETRQPRNASPLSVHPAGMAVDLRIPAGDSARSWLEHWLLSLEQAGAIDVTREHWPPHLHVAVFPEAFRAYAARQDSAAARVATAERAARAAAAARPAIRAAAAPGANGSGRIRYGLLGAMMFGAVAVVGSAATQRRRPRG